MLEPNLDNPDFNWNVFKAQHPEWHLHRDLCQRLPKYTRIVEQLSRTDWDKLIPLNNRGLPF